MIRIMEEVLRLIQSHTDIIRIIGIVEMHMEMGRYLVTYLERIDQYVSYDIIEYDGRKFRLVSFEC